MKASVLALAVPILGSLLQISDAPAAGQRSFVSGGGADVGTCTPIAPCRSFGYAIGQTLANGEIIVLDSAGYGPVVINKAIKLVVPPGMYGGITVFTGNGVTVNAGATNIGVLRGLTITGLAAGATNGIAVLTAGTTHVEGCILSGFDTGLLYELATGSALIVADSVLRDNDLGINALGFGPKGRLEVVRSRLHHNLAGAIKLRDVDRASVADSYLTSNGNGIEVVITAASTAATSLSVQRTEINQNTLAGVMASGTGLHLAEVNIANSTIVGNQFGIHILDGGFAAVAGTQITGNDTGVLGSGLLGEATTFGTNGLYGNNFNGFFGSSMSLQ